MSNLAFPIHAEDYRTYPDTDWEGDIFTCDIDRTYLWTRFSSLKGLLRIPFETAVDKLSIIGMPALFRELRRGPKKQSRLTPLYFISASPAQLRPIIEKKMILDGMEFDGFTFKNWTEIFRSGHFHGLRDQIGFKLSALIQRRKLLPPGAIESLIGDDLESDATAYAIYADLLSGRLAGRQLEELLVGLNVSKEIAKRISDDAPSVHRKDGVKRIYLRLERFRDTPEQFLDFSPHIVACRNPFQMAIALYSDHQLSIDGVKRVADCLAHPDQDDVDLLYELCDCVSRCFCSTRTAKKISDLLALDPTLPDFSVLQPVTAWRRATERSRDRRWTPHA